jgi:ABC-type thiamine transport system ATPase subunit
MDQEKIAVQLSKALKLLEENRKRVETAMRENPDLDTGHVKLANEVAKASVELSKEYRAWAKTSNEVGKKLTLAEKVDLTVQFILKLNATQRRELLERIK